MSNYYYSGNSASFQPDSTAARILAALASYDLKAEGKSGHYRCNSPLRPGSNSHGFTLVIGDGEHGAYFDHVSGEAGSLYELAPLLNIEHSRSESPRQPIEDSKRCYVGLADYAQAHGVPAEVFAAAGWKQITYQKRPALSFKTQTGTRYRFLDDTKSVYRSPKGYQRCWYGLKRAVQIAKENGQPLVICNGEASTVVAQHFGLAACAVTGGERQEMPIKLLNELKAAYSGAVVVAFDCLDSGAKAAPGLAAQLEAAGFSAQTVDLGLGKGGDLADFCRLHHKNPAADLAQLVAAPTTQITAQATGQVTEIAPVPPIDGRMHLIPGDDVLKLPRQKWLLPNEIPEEGLVLLYGDTGIGKSFVALDYAMRLAQEHTVLYMPAEGYPTYAERLRAWCAYHRLPAANIFFPNEEVILPLLDPQVVKDFIAIVNNTASNIKSTQPISDPLPKPKFIVFDTLAWCMTGGDENSTADMQKMISHCRIIQKATGATVMLVHHTGKTGSSARGSSALPCGVDLAVMATEEENDLIALTTVKARSSKRLPKRQFKRLEVPTGLEGETSCVVVSVPVDVETVPQSEPRRKTHTLDAGERDVLGVLASSVFVETGANANQLNEMLPRYSRSGLYKLIGRLNMAGLIQQSKRGDPFKISEKGKAFFAPQVILNKMPEGSLTAV